jgi:hypothetical protein
LDNVEGYNHDTDSVIKREIFLLNAADFGDGHEEM